METQHAIVSGLQPNRLPAGKNRLQREEESMKTESRRCVRPRFERGWTKETIRAGALTLAALATLLSTATPVRAVTCIVASVDDSGPGTLRDAIVNQTCDTVTFDASIVPGTINLTGGQLTIGRSLTITGPGPNSLTVQRQSASSFRVFEVLAPNTVAISGLTIANGLAAYGGGISNRGTLTVTNSTFSGNSVDTQFGSGGGIWNNIGATLTVDGTTFLNNGNSICIGGGIYNFFGQVEVRSSTFSGNSAGQGGGIDNQGGSGQSGTLTVINSTFVNNSTVNAGGGIVTSAPLTVTNSTFYGNAAGFGGGIANTGGPTPTVLNTIIANSAGGNCGGAIADGGGNLSSDGTCPATFKFSNTDPMLGPLDNNGGTTQTMALLPGSPAVDTAQGTNCPSSDQRGVSRPQGSGCDMGAFELVQQSGPVFSGFFAPLSNTGLNIVKAGSAVPVKFSLGGDWTLSIIASGYPTSQQISCNTLAGASEITETVTAGNSSLSYDPVTQIYTYVWKTDKAWTNTCRRLAVRFSDNGGTTKTADFGFTK